MLAIRFSRGRQCIRHCGLPNWTVDRALLGSGMTSSVGKAVFVSNASLNAAEKDHSLVCSVVCYGARRNKKTTQKVLKGNSGLQKKKKIECLVYLRFVEDWVVHLIKEIH